MYNNLEFRLIDIIKNGGATLSSDGLEVNYNSGYQVSKKDCYTIKAEKITEIKKAVFEILKRIKKSDFCGIWVDGGLVYIDISERIKNAKKALAIGRSRKQISIFDWALKNCIYC